MTIIMPKTSTNCMIRDYEESDIRLIAEIEFDEETKNFVGIPKGTKEEWISRTAVDILFGWAVVVLPEMEVAGRVCLVRPKDRAPGVVELEIIISKKFWGRGLGREVASLMVTAAFNEINATSIRAEVHPENKASLRAHKQSKLFRAMSSTDSKDGVHLCLVYREVNLQVVTNGS